MLNPAGESESYFGFDRTDVVDFSYWTKEIMIKFKKKKKCCKKWKKKGKACKKCPLSKFCS